MKTNGSNFFLKWLLCLLIGISSVNIAWCATYFQTKTGLVIGAWETPGNWESAPAMGGPYASTLAIPDNTATGIFIRSGTTITLTAGTTYSSSNLTIDPGGVLNHANTAVLNSKNVFTVNGTYVLNGTQVVLTSTNTCVVSNTGVVRVDANTGGASDDFAYNNTRVTFATDAVFQWNVSSKFDVSNNTYFNSASNSPIFRVSQNLTGVNFIGVSPGNNAVVFNGRFEVNAGITVEFGNGQKTFRDGIGGAGTLVHQQSVTGVHGPSGLFWITGTGPVTVTPSIYGTVTINIEAVGSTTDMEISGNTLITGSPTINIGTSSFPGGYLVVSGALTHNGTVPINLIYGNLTISGTVSNSSTGFFTENNTSSTITNITINGSGTDAGLVNFTNSPLDFKSITVNRSGGSFTLTDNTTIENTTTLTTGALILNGKSFTMNSSLVSNTGNGTFTGSSSSEIYVGGSGGNGTFYFTSGSQLLNKLTLNRTIPLPAAAAVTLGTNLTVNNLVLISGILVTGTNTAGTVNNLLTLTTGSGLTQPSSYEKSFIATCQANGNKLPFTPPFSGAYGFRIQNVGSTDTYFPVGTTYLAFAGLAATPNRMMINNSGTPDDFTVIVRKQTLPNTANPSVNRIWFVNEGAANGSNVTMKLFFTKRTSTFGTVQDEVESGFDWFKTDLVQENYSNAYLNKAAGADEKDWSNASWIDKEVYGLYTEGVSSDYLNLTNGINNFTRFSVTNASTIILPVNMTNLRASQKGNDIQIDWSAMNELNMDHYEVEHSQNGISFTAVTKVVAINNGPLQHNYTALDSKPVQGTNFYRIKAIDKNGAISYTVIVSVNISGGKATITVLPNPVQNRTMNVRFDNLDAGNYTMLLYNSAGQLVFNKKIVHGGGSAAQSYVLPAGVRTGVYALRLLNDANKTEFRNTIVIAE